MRFELAVNVPTDPNRKLSRHSAGDYTCLARQSSSIRSATHLASDRCFRRPILPSWLSGNVRVILPSSPGGLSRAPRRVASESGKGSRSPARQRWGSWVMVDASSSTKSRPQDIGR